MPSSWRGAAGTRAWCRPSFSAANCSSPPLKAEALADRDPSGLLGEAALSLYGAAGRVGAPIAAAFLKWRERNGKEDAAHRGERLGIASRARPQGPLIWVHAASVGETNAALPLIERLSAYGTAILLTTGTVTAARIAGGRLPAGAMHQFVPIDTPGAARAFLDHWRPDLALFAESELWPTMLRALRRRQIPLVIVNARMSERSFRSWRVFSPLSQAVLGCVDLFLARSETDAGRLRALGAKRVLVCGNLKFDVPPPAADMAVLTGLREAIAGRRVLLAASTHPGEEESVIAAHRRIAGAGTRLFTILAPRHPQRGDAIAALVAGAGPTLARRSLGDQVARDTEVYLADTIGEMGTWYRLADVAFLGGSMVPRGGQNPIEPAKLMVPIVHGEHVDNFRDVYKALGEAKAVTTVRDATSLAAAVGHLIGDDRERERRAADARACVERFAGALDHTLEALGPYLETLHRHEASTRA